MRTITGTQSRQRPGPCGAFQRHRTGCLKTLCTSIPSAVKNMIITLRYCCISWTPTRYKGRLQEIDAPDNKRSFYKPEKAAFFRSDKVIELEWLLAEILEDHEIRLKLIASVCAVEGCSYTTQTQLLDLPPAQLSKVIISGTLAGDDLLFPPSPILFLPAILAL